MLRMRGRSVGVEAATKSDKKHGILFVPEDSNAAGVIRYLGDALASSDLKVGMRVYYGDKRQPMTINGLALFVMDADNILAVEDLRETEENQEVRKI